MASVAIAAASTELATPAEVQGINKPPNLSRGNPATRLNGVWHRTACIAVTTLGYYTVLPAFRGCAEQVPVPRYGPGNNSDRAAWGRSRNRLEAS